MKIIIMCVFWLVVGVINTHTFLNPRAVEQRLSKKIVKSFKGGWEKERFNCGGILMENLRGEKTFVSAHRFQEIVDKINKVLK